MNFIKWLGLVLTREAKDVYEYGHEHVVHTMRVLYLAIAVPAVLLVLGVIFGAVGENASITWMVGTAQWMLSIAGFLAALLLTLFWVRAVVFSYLIVIASKGARWVWREIPDVELETAQAFLRWLRGVTLWISAAALYAQIVPVWRNVGVSLVVGTCVFIFSAMMSAQWFDGKWARRFLAFAVVAIFATSTVTLVSPGFARSVRTSVERRFDRADTANERRNRLSAIDREAESRATEVDAALLRQLGERRNELRRRAVELCRGVFCSEEERREYAELGTRMDRIRAGTYWDSGNGDRRASDAGADRALPAVPARRSSAAMLPPPPVRRGTEHVDRPAHRDTSRTSTVPRLSEEDADEVFEELDTKYADAPFW